MGFYQYSGRVLMLPILLCLAGLLGACQAGPDDASAPEGLQMVSLSVTNYRQISFDDLSAGETRATETVSMTLANMSLTVFDAETGAIVTPTILHKSDDYLDKPLEFPSFTIALPSGRYRVLVLGYNGSQACNIQSLERISWADNYVPNTFLYEGELVVDKGTSLNKEVTLEHVVAAFRLNAEDAIPSEMKKMRFIGSAGGTVLNARTGLAVQNTGRTSDIVVPASYVGRAGVDFTAYIFLPEEQTTGSYTVQALGQNDAILYEKRFGDVCALTT